MPHPNEPQPAYWPQPAPPDTEKKDSVEAPTEKKAKAPTKATPLIKRKSKKNHLNYYWSVDENRRYCDFLMRYPNIFSLPTNQKKNMRVNVMMSKKVKTRNPQQCHSHHQKMVKKYGSIAEITTVMARELDMHVSETPKLEEDPDF